MVREVEIRGTPLRVTDEEVTFGSVRLKTTAITAVRYGALFHTTNDIPDHKSYALWVTDGRETIEVECARGLFVRAKTAEDRFHRAVDAIWQPVVIPICERMVRTYRDGGGFTIAGADTPWWSLTSSVNVRHDPTLVFDQAGIHQTKPETKHLLWRNFDGYSIENGELRISASTYSPTWRDKLNGREWWATLSLRQTWNAVCLDPVLKRLKQERLR